MTARTETSPAPDDEAGGKPCCDDYREHRYSCPLREWPATATPEVRRGAVRGDSIESGEAEWAYRANELRSCAGSLRMLAEDAE
jgi:hypothetical protein